MSAELIAAACALAMSLGSLVSSRKQREAEGEPSVDWRCRLGLHRWKPTLSLRDTPSAFVGGILCAGIIYVAGTASEPRVWRKTGRKCRRCGKRK